MDEMPQDPRVIQAYRTMVRNRLLDIQRDRTKIYFNMRYFDILSASYYVTQKRLSLMLMRLVGKSKRLPTIGK